LVILEFSKPDNSLTGKIFRFYFNQLLPKAGGLVSGDLAAYRYLPESVNAFPDGNSFLEVISDAGFRNCRFRRLTLGIATIYFGIKPL
jgi:demethylmenaquinone methyltransferase/2-methoxy-6-polyprenyl-1,4-benzoquinol methylase